MRALACVRRMTGLNHDRANRHDAKKGEMMETATPNREQFPDRVGGCPPGSHFWQGSFHPDHPTPPICIVDRPKPDCGGNSILKQIDVDLLGRADASQPYRWLCEKCPEGMEVRGVNASLHGKATVFECAHPTPALSYGYREFARDSEAFFPYILPTVIAIVSIVLLVGSLRRRD
jgi:hypothetical protein